MALFVFVLICDAIKLNQSFVDQDQFSVLLLVEPLSESLILAKAPSQLDLTFQWYDHFSVTQNKQIQRKLRVITGFISKSIFLTNDWFSLIISHMWPALAKQGTSHQRHLTDFRINTNQHASAVWYYGPIIFKITFVQSFGSCNATWTMPGIMKFSKPSTSATFTLQRIFYCIAHTCVVIGCQRDQLLLGRLLWMNLCRTQCKLRFPRDVLVKGLLNLIIGHSWRYSLTFVQSFGSCNASWTMPGRTHLKK